MKKLLLASVLFSLGLSTLSAQGTLIPIGNPAYHTIKRLDILSDIPMAIHTSVQYYSRGDVVRYAMRLDSSSFNLSKLDRADLQYIFLDNNEWLSQPERATALAEKNQEGLHGDEESSYWKASRKPFLKHFYRTPANLFEVSHPDFTFRVNPMLNLKYGNQIDDETPYFINQRGLEIRGSFDERIHFYSSIIESQANFPGYLRRYIDQYSSLPRNGFYKRGFSSDLLNFNRGYDFLNSQAYLAFNVTDHVGVQFGYGQNFIGQGYRSMLLSDFSNNQLYLKLNWRVWKLHFQNIFAELKSQSAQSLGGSQLVPKKYMAAHYLSFNVTPNLEFGLYEAVIFNRQNQFEFQYLNPVILYRTIEQSVGSPDNVLIGINAKWNLWQRLQLYGQFILDEFKFDELIINQDGWWGNKYGLQLGLNYPNVGGVDHLDLQLEYNTARPYTYMHFDSLSNYTHFGAPLAHPLGANFKEYIALLTYRPHPRWLIDGRLIVMDYGADIEGANYGREWNASYNSRVQDYGNETLQGTPVRNVILGLDISYSLRHNVFLDLHYFNRSSNLAGNIDDQYLSAGVRVNMRNFRADF